MATGKGRTKATTTVNPLHFEDLEPHRFEDLIRQLAYGFRQWGRLEATGRLGQDEGVDIRGVEFVMPATSAASEQEDEDNAVNEVAEMMAEREWRIQCKRYQTIGPKLMRNTVREAVRDMTHPPYGLIIAAACDVSAQTMAAFHDERVKLGVREGHLWVRAHLEDMLFRPENDNLLFAYFGLSLGSRRRSALSKIQAALTVKRKLLRAYKAESLESLRNEDVLIRDVEDVTYPTEGPRDGKDIFSIYPWFGAEIYGVYVDGLLISRQEFTGWIKPDGTWDLLVSSSQLAGEGRGFDQWEEETDEDRDYRIKRHEQAFKVMEFVPLAEHARIELMNHLPFASILEVDTIGDVISEGVHLYCRYAGADGPFNDAVRFHTIHPHSKVWLDPKMHRPLFPELIIGQLEEGKLQESELTTVWPLILNDEPRSPAQRAHRAKKRRE
jgi:hypothetical protein